MDLSDSGIGDFGTEGINTFINGHECGAICKRLGLDEGIPLKLASTTMEKGNGLGEPCEKDTSDQDDNSDDDDNNSDHSQNIT